MGFPLPSGVQVGPRSGELTVWGAGPAEGQAGTAGTLPVRPPRLGVRLMWHRLGSLSLAPTSSLLPGSGAPHVQLWKLHSRGVWAVGQEEETRPGLACSRHPRPFLWESCPGALGDWCPGEAPEGPGSCAPSSPHERAGRMGHAVIRVVGEAKSGRVFKTWMGVFLN